MVALDTNVYIYFLEKNPDFFDISEQAIQYALQSGTIPVSTITIMEIASGSPSQQVINFFANKQFSLHSFTTELAVLAGQLRYNNGSLKAADAIHLATALASGADQFITNDDRLHKLQLGIEIITFKQLETFISKHLQTE